MQLDLSAEDRDLLVHLLESALAETRVESRHTDDPSFRERLQHERDSLRRLADQLRKLD
jgi:hypothetical protein